jgi:hypothetical protein
LQHYQSPNYRVSLIRDKLKPARLSRVPLKSTNHGKKLDLCPGLQRLKVWVKASIFRPDLNTADFNTGDHLLIWSCFVSVISLRTNINI